MEFWLVPLKLPLTPHSGKCQPLRPHPPGVSSSPLRFTDTHTDDASQRLHIPNRLIIECLPHLTGTSLVQATTFSCLDLAGASSLVPMPLPSNLQAPTFPSNLHRHQKGSVKSQTGPWFCSKPFNSSASLLN